MLNTLSATKAPPSSVPSTRDVCRARHPRSPPLDAPPYQNSVGRAGAHTRRQGDSSSSSSSRPTHVWLSVNGECGPPPPHSPRPPSGWPRPGSRPAASARRRPEIRITESERGRGAGSRQQAAGTRQAAPPHQGEQHLRRVRPSLGKQAGWLAMVGAVLQRQSSSSGRHTSGRATGWCVVSSGKGVRPYAAAEWQTCGWRPARAIQTPRVDL